MARGRSGSLDILAGSPRNVYVLLESKDSRKAIFAHGECRMVELSRLVQSGPELRLMPCGPLEVVPTIVDADA